MRDITKQIIRQSTIDLADALDKVMVPVREHLSAFTSEILAEPDMDDEYIQLMAFYESNRRMSKSLREIVKERDELEQKEKTGVKFGFIPENEEPVKEAA